MFTDCYGTYRRFRDLVCSAGGSSRIVVVFIGSMLSSEIFEILTIFESVFKGDFLVGEGES
jgi:hypothetical protein